MQEHIQTKHVEQWFTSSIWTHTEKQDRVLIGSDRGTHRSSAHNACNEMIADGCFFWPVHQVQSPFPGCLYRAAIRSSWASSSLFQWCFPSDTSSSLYYITPANHNSPPYFIFTFIRNVPKFCPGSVKQVFWVRILWPNQQKCVRVSIGVRRYLEY